MKKLFIINFLFITVFEIFCQSPNREVEFYVGEKKICLNNNFEITIIDSNKDTLSLVPVKDNIIKIPSLFSSRDSFILIFNFNKYKLIFNKALGADINFETKWKFKISKYPFDNDKVLLNKIPPEVDEVFIWEFEPSDRDGWIIYEPNSTPVVRRL